MTDPAHSTSQSGAEAYCITCGYDLRGRPSGKCPECGTGFDRNDPNSFSSHAPKSAVESKERVRLRWTGVIVFIIGFATCIGIGVEGIPSYGGVMSLLLSLLFGVCCLVVGVLSMQRSMRPFPSRVNGDRYLSGWDVVYAVAFWLALMAVFAFAVFEGFFWE